jgi:predicted DNA-binding protein
LEVSPVKDRIHIVLPAEEKERYRAIAEREGTTLSRWIREAVRERATRYDVERKLDTVEDLESFFQECDQLHQGTDAAEPDWEEHERLIHESRTGGLEVK